ncbi:MAG: class I SAM-dependent methyltransferase [Candidatus Thiodiazotropha sp.]
MQKRIDKMMNKMEIRVEANTGSFRDPVNQVYEVKPKPGSEKVRILRGLSNEALSNYKQLSAETFFRKALDAGYVVKTELLEANDKDGNTVLADGWAGVLEHIDVASVEPWEEGEPWVGYRQFCSMFLAPLMLRSYLGIDHLPILRSFIDGIPPIEAAKYFTGTKRFKKGILSHIVFPAKVENSIAKRERDDAPARQRTSNKHSKAMVLGLVQSLKRLVQKLSIEIKHTDWSQYDKTHSYQEAELDAKKAFVIKHASTTKRQYVWDIGCNTGTFSKITSEYCKQVISIDGDHDAVEQLYLKEKNNTNSNILPLVMNLANISPGQGWACSERQAFDQRRKPDLVLCLALIHHLRLSANIPNVLFLKWLRSLESAVILEFVNREDEMVVKLLTNKKEQYEDYNLDQFVAQAEQFFTIKDRESLKGGKREIFYLIPR